MQEDIPEVLTSPQLLKEVCLQIPLRTKNRKTLSEKLTKRHLEKRGWKVWRGGSFNAHKDEDAYPNVKLAYERLNTLMERHHPAHAETLRYLCHVHHGMPDFVAYKNGRFKFIECKLIYESLSARQKRCIVKLVEMGFMVEIYRIVDKRTRIRKANVDITNGKKEQLEIQERLLFTRKRKLKSSKGCSVVNL